MGRQSTGIVVASLLIVVIGTVWIVEGLLKAVPVCAAIGDTLGERIQKRYCKVVLLPRHFLEALAPDDKPPQEVVLEDEDAEVVARLTAAVLPPDFSPSNRDSRQLDPIVALESHSLWYWLSGEQRQAHLQNKVMEIQKHLRDAPRYWNARMYDQAINELRLAEDKILSVAMRTGYFVRSPLELRICVLKVKYIKRYEAWLSETRRAREWGHPRGITSQNRPGNSEQNHSLLVISRTS